jgi:hypothetical protein
MRFIILLVVSLVLRCNAPTTLSRWLNSQDGRLQNRDTPLEDAVLSRLNITLDQHNGRFRSTRWRDNFRIICRYREFDYASDDTRLVGALGRISEFFGEDNNTLKLLYCISYNQQLSHHRCSDLRFCTVVPFYNNNSHRDNNTPKLLYWHAIAQPARTTSVPSILGEAARRGGH